MNGHIMLSTSLVKPFIPLAPKPTPLRKQQPTIARVEEVRVCTNRTCRRQGSFQTLEVLTDLAPPGVAVKSCGCLGRCGAGPNIALVPQGIIVGHCGTASRAASVMVEVANVTDASMQNTLEAVALRKRAQVEIEDGNFEKADNLLSQTSNAGRLMQAIEKKPFGGLHIIYKCRSVARLGMGNYPLALEDARSALALAPQYLEAYMCEGDAFMEMGKYTEAENSYSTCLQVDPSVRRWKSFKTRVAELQEKLTALGTAGNE